MTAEPRYTPTPPPDTEPVGCLDCGAVIFDTAAHTRFHSILGGHAHALAVLQTAHLSPSTHDRYDVYERISAKKFDNWSADALAEVIATHEEDEA